MRTSYELFGFSNIVQRLNQTCFSKMAIYFLCTQSFTLYIEYNENYGHYYNIDQYKITTFFFDLFQRFKGTLRFYYTFYQRFLKLQSKKTSWLTSFCQPNSTHTHATRISTCRHFENVCLVTTTSVLLKSIGPLRDLWPTCTGSPRKISRWLHPGATEYRTSHTETYVPTTKSRPCSAR